MNKYIQAIFFLLISVLTSLSAAEMIITLRNGNIDSLTVADVSTIYIADSSNNTIVRLSEPFNGAINISLLPILKWRIVPGQQYELMISLESDFNSTVIHITGLDDNIYQIYDTLASQTTYYWKVRSMSSEEWSAVWRFTTYAPTPPGKIKSFAIINSETPNSLEIRLNTDDSIDKIIALLSSDGRSFPDTLRLDITSVILTDLQLNRVYYIKIMGSNTAGPGPVSEVLAGIPSNENCRIMIINGFDRGSAGNTYNFIRQHASAINYYGNIFESASNDAITDGLVNLTDYQIVDYILGEESTVDETFNYAEQDKIEAFLQNGGKLFVSGSEIAWDLDNKGSSADKSFCSNFLKMNYAADAPNNEKDKWYSVESLTGTFFNAIPGFSFDNGNHGTYQVDWPDVFNVSNGGQGFLKYTNYSTSNGYAGVLFDGLFPDGTKPGKLVITGFPFETIYPDSTRNLFMSEVIQFFEYISDIEPKTVTANQFALFQNYPNPFNNTTIIPFLLPGECDVKIMVYDLLGRKVMQIADRRFTNGYHRVTLITESLSSGEYLYTLEAGDFRATKKFSIIK